MLHLRYPRYAPDFEDINKNKYLTLVPANESKEIIKKYEKNCGVKSEI